jgi:glutamate 5-kinase
MASKLEAARMATTSGENVIIASGREPGILRRIVAGEAVGTLFLAQGGTLASRKRWIGFTAQPRGSLVLDDGARQAIERQGRSLLPIGVRDAAGEFQKGDIVALVDVRGIEFARGLTNYSLAEVMRIKGLRTDEITSLLGYLPYAELVHRDNMTVTTGEGQ